MGGTDYLNNRIQIVVIDFNSHFCIYTEESGYVIGSLSINAMFYPCPS